MDPSISFHKHCNYVSDRIDKKNNMLKSDSSFKKIQTAQNAALRTATGAHKMASIDHLHQESLTLRGKDHSVMLSTQYLVNCLEEDHVNHGITIQVPKPRPMKENLHSIQHSTVLPILGSNRMESQQNLNTDAVDSAEDNDVLSHNYGQNTAIYCRTTSIGCCCCCLSRPGPS